MSTENQRERLTVDQEVGRQLARMKSVWRAQEWEPVILAEYRRVLGKAEEPETVASVVDRAIDKTEGRFPPSVGAFARAITDANTRRRLDKRTEHPHRSRSLDESALLDALAYVDGCTNDTDRAYGERQVKSIRERLADRGAMAEARVKVRFKRAPNYPNDPPGTVRYVPMVVEGADTYVFPRGPKNGGAALAAIAPLALVVISGAWRVIG